MALLLIAALAWAFADRLEDTFFIPGDHPAIRYNAAPTTISSTNSRPMTHAGAPPSGGHLQAFLPQPRLCLSGLGGLGQSPRQWAS